MVDTVTVQMAQRGVLVLPKALRDTYSLKPGDRFTLLDMGGVFVLAPRESRVDAPTDRIASELLDEGETLETMLQALREERQTPSHLVHI